MIEQFTGDIVHQKGNCMGNEEAITGEYDVKNPRNVMRHKNYLYLVLSICCDAVVGKCGATRSR